MSSQTTGCWSPLIERALRIAATHHHSQTRKGGVIPYVTHPFGVAMLLQRFGFDDDELLAAALLHDVVEDTECTLDDLEREFPPSVVEIVASLSERKDDDQGQLRPWKERKLEHIAHVQAANLEARAIVLADKLHNLATMKIDLDSGQDVWSRFRADRNEVEWYHRTMIDAACQYDESLQPLANACRRMLDSIMKQPSADCMKG